PWNFSFFTPFFACNPSTSWFRHKIQRSRFQQEESPILFFYGGLHELVSTRTCAGPRSGDRSAKEADSESFNGFPNFLDTQFCVSLENTARHRSGPPRLTLAGLQRASIALGKSGSS